LFHVHVVEQETVEDGLANLIGEVGMGFDAIDVGAEGGTTVARGFLFGGRDVDDDDGVIGNAADRSLMEAFAVAAAAALGTRGSFRGMAAKEVDGFGALAVFGVLVMGLGMR
jgi:hypothetical protein